jgi:hypothetical protein
MRRLLVAGVAAGLVTLVLFVGNRTSRHPGLTTRRLSDDADRHAVDACEYCERLTRDWEKRVCGILSGGADGRGFFSDYFSGIAATATRGIIADDFSPEDYKFLENVKNAGGYPAFVEARVEVAVLAELMSRGGKLPDELICVAVEFLGLELPRWKPAPKKQ